MKKSIKHAGKMNGDTGSVHATWSTQRLLYLVAFVCTCLFTACKKYKAVANDEAISARTNSANEGFINSDAALPAQTIAELFKVRAATEKYMDTAAARADGYEPVITLPNMG
jgi:hypothetical protein